MRLKMHTSLALSFIAATCLASCSPEAPPLSSSNDLICVVGSAARGCSCSGGASGQQSCNAGSWSTCSCAGLSDAGLASTGEAGASMTSGTGPNASPNAATKSDLPCEVATLFASRCGNCHGRNNESPAPMKLESWADLMANTPSDPQKKVFESALARVQDNERPMPPPQFGPRLSASEIASLQAWVNGGAKAADAGQSCAPSSPGVTGDAGTAPSAPTVDTTDSPKDCEQYYELRAHKDGTKDAPFEVPSGAGLDGNMYHCFYFSPEYLNDSQGLWFKSLADNKKILHHWLLYASDFDAIHEPGSNAPCTAAEPGAYLIAGWAPGAPDYKPPADVGLSLPQGPDARLILEVHWFNDSGSVQQDHSGVRFCTAKKDTRPHTAGIHFTGGEGICLEPGQPQDVVGMCDPGDNEDIHLLRVWPHMHRLGRHMRVTILRGGGAREVIHDGPFDFNDQRAYDLNDVLLHPGDQLETVCSYMNTTSAPVPFGEDTQQEMCFGFITAWPAGSLVNGVLDLSSWIGGPLQPARRCLDPLGILNSCNGLADYPAPGG